MKEGRQIKTHDMLIIPFMSEVTEWGDMLDGLRITPGTKLLLL
jgi:hypothetical protein